MFATRVTAASLAVLSLAGSALGHGYATNFNADGTDYPMWKPWTDPYESPVPDRVGRKITNDGPITDYSSPDIACNKGGAAPQKITAKVSAGGNVRFDWTTWPKDHAGPVSVSMASCNGPCSKLDLSQAGNSVKWFKVSAKGYDAGAKRWASDDLIDAGSTWTATIPADLQGGEYLIRNEIVALHSLPAQAYSVCAQVTVTGSGNAKPSDDQTFNLPGLYDGYTWPYIWGDFNFKLAGPDVFSGSGSSGNSEPAPASQSSSSSAVSVPTKVAVASPSSTPVATPTDTATSTPATTEAAPAPTATSTCRRKRSTVAKRNETVQKAEYYKRHTSRRSHNRLASHH